MILQQQVQRAISSSDNNNQGDFEDNNDSDGDGDNTGTPARAPRYSKTPKDAAPKPTTLKYYQGAWQTILITAKNKMRRHVALVNAFPERENHLEEATALITKTISEYREKGVPLKGKSSLYNQLVISEYFILGFVPNRDMSVLVG